MISFFGFDMLMFTYTIARDLISQVSTKKGIAVVAQDILWLWRMAYNSAVRGCSIWECPEDLVLGLSISAERSEWILLIPSILIAKWERVP